MLIQIKSHDMTSRRSVSRKRVTVSVYHRVVSISTESWTIVILNGHLVSVLKRS